MLKELESLQQQESQAFLRHEYKQAYDLGLNTLLSMTPMDMSGMIGMLQLQANVKQLKKFLEKENLLIDQIKEEQERRKQKKELKG